MQENTHPQKLLAEMLGTAVLVFRVWRDVPGYVAAQVAGAVLGALAIVGVLGEQAVDLGLGSAAYGTGVGAGQAFFAEAVGTFILAFGVFGAIDRRAAGGFAGLAIGLGVFAIIIPIAPTTAAAINPARTLGPMITGELFGGTVHWDQLPVYLAAELIGAVAAGVLYTALNGHRKAATPTPAENRDVEPAPAEGALS